MINRGHGKRIGVIILNYNNWQDTVDCVTLLLKQNWPEFMVVVVDNASSDGSVEKMKAEWTSGSDVNYLAEYQKGEAEDGGTAEKENELSKYRPWEKVVLIKNDKNLGYSAGNNVGIRYAIKKDAEAVLIVNPDVRIDDHDALRSMIDVMFSNDAICVVGPNIIDAAGSRQNPLREPTFIEECINPFISAIKKRTGNQPVNYLIPIRTDKPFEVEKVAGSCLLIRTSFLQKIGLLDENVFLYCEEPILAYRIMQCGGTIIYAPFIDVKHMHKTKKFDSADFALFVNSRFYFLSKYKKYNFFKIVSLRISYGCILIYKKILNRINK